MLITNEEFSMLKSRAIVPLECYHCKCSFYKKKHEVQTVLSGKLTNRAHKFCSVACFALHRQSQEQIKCTNCSVTFFKRTSLIKKSKNHFCCQSCNAKYQNRNKVKQVKTERICKFCNNNIQKQRGVYCSRNCYKEHMKTKRIERLEDNEIKTNFTLKRALKHLGFNVCKVCGLSEEWEGKKLVLQLDHIDGNPNNNSIDNVRLLCPNCHSQTPTFGCNKR